MREKGSDDKINVWGIVGMEARLERTGNEMRDEEIEIEHGQIFKQVVL